MNSRQEKQLAELEKRLQNWYSECVKAVEERHREVFS